MSVEARLKSSDGIELYTFIKEQRGIVMVEKVNVILKDVKLNTIIHSFNPMGLL